MSPILLALKNWGKYIVVNRPSACFCYKPLRAEYKQPIEDHCFCLSQKTFAPMNASRRESTVTCFASSERNVNGFLSGRTPICGCRQRPTNSIPLALTSACARYGKFKFWKAENVLHVK